VVYDRLPKASHHGWKFIDFGPDGRLYVPVGAPCNACEVESPSGSLLSMRADGSDVQVYARGIRNTVGFAWHPRTHELWFSDNGRDMLGDDLPPCEINRATRAGLHFGFPYMHGGDVPDPEFGRGHTADEFMPPAWKLGAHVAPLGLEFYHG
jgi:glucose/arabinose dehydrogenase